MVGALTIILLFAAAWLLAQAAFVALKVLVWNDRRSADHDLTKTGKMTRLKQRETRVSIVPMPRSPTSGSGCSRALGQPADRQCRSPDSDHGASSS